MTERHNRDFFFIAKTGELRGSVTAPPSSDGTRTATAAVNVREATTAEAERLFRFSEIVETISPPPDESLLEAVAEIMTENVPDIDSHIPAGYTYLGQFIDHDLTRDVTKNLPLGSPVSTPEQLEQGRSPALDLDSLYGAGPVVNPEFYQADRIKLKVGKTKASGSGTSPDARDLDGFDLPRLGSQAVEPEDFRKAQIPDQRNDENLAIAQTHLAFIRFHNRVSDQLASKGVPSAMLFERARELVTKHYQWMLVKDYLPRIVDPGVVNDVFTSGRLIFEPGASSFPTMPLEFSVGAFRLGHSMIREKYEWNAFFRSNGIFGDFATLFALFTFSGTSGNLSPGTDPDNPLEGGFERLPTNWIADWPLLFDFVEAGVPELAPETFLNLARPIDIRLTDPLKQLPLGSFGARNPSMPPLPPADKRRNLAFRNLVRARMVSLATGQELAAKINHELTAAGRGAEAITPLSRSQILGTEFSTLPPQQQDDLANHTPLWLYTLREASLNKINGRDGTGRLGAVGGRIVAEVFHRAIEGSRISFLRDPEFTPTLGRTQGVFRMADLLLVAYDATKGELRPLSPSAPRPGKQSPPTGDAQLVVRNLSLKTPNFVGSDVSALQAALNRQGARLTVDGVFGAITRAAVVQWQTDRGLVVDGVVGIQTRSSLGLQRLIRLQEPRQRGDDVRAIQPVLEREAQVRLQTADGSFDGIFGPLTASAVRKFQSLRGLLVDGVVGPLTLKSLRLIR
jgi:peptidoglycan hydrolase-like protein with peptidoglycan-binding domain